MTRTALVAAAFFFLGSLVLQNFNHADPPQAQPRQLRHVVLFKFKADAAPEQILAVERGFAALPQKIDAILDFEWGTNNSPEGLDRGYTHCFLVTFRSEADRKTYLEHPAHRQFVNLLLPVLDEPHVIDYWAAR